MLLEQAARAGDGVAVGAWIFDSDYGQVVAVGEGRGDAVAIGADAAEGPLEHDADAFDDWSACTPQPLTAAEVEAIVGRDDVFAEKTADELSRNSAAKAASKYRTVASQPPSVSALTPR